jgi:hypothetical protein
MQAFAYRLISRRRTLDVAQYDHDDALLRAGYGYRDGKPVERGHHRGHSRTLQPIGLRARDFFHISAPAGYAV